MSGPNPIPAGPKIEADWRSNKPASIPRLPPSWTATVLLTPFGDSISPLTNPTQLIVGFVESSSTAKEGWLRARLFLTLNKRYVDFFFVQSADAERCDWYWIDTNPAGDVKSIFGPFPTTLQIPPSQCFEMAGARWGNVYPLMCAGDAERGIACDHWVVPTPGFKNHGTWFAFRKETADLFRVFALDSNNPLMFPILGSFYMTNLPTFTHSVSDGSKSLAERIAKGETKARAGYWNPLVTQEDIHRAMAFPLADAAHTPDDIAAVIPGFAAMQSTENLPRWSDRTYIEGWTTGTDFIPYVTRVCYLWTGSKDSKQQTVFIGFGTVPGQGNYLQRRDTCLDTSGTVQPYYQWDAAANDWVLSTCLTPNPPVGLPKPDWLARDEAVIVGQIRGNPNFGLAEDQTLNLIAGRLDRGGGELAIFWVWFLENGHGMLFSEGNYLNPLSHNLQLIDYNHFVQNAAITQNTFSNPCAPASKRHTALAAADMVRGHLTIPA